MISITISDTELVTVLKQIEKQAEVDFSFSSTLIPEHYPVNISAQNQPLNTVLANLFEGLPIVYREINNQIVLVKKPAQVPRNQPSSEQKRIPSKTEGLQTIIYDTIIELRYDTITTLNFDTLIVVDTIRHFDTLRVIERIQHKARFYINTYYAPVVYTSLKSQGEVSTSLIATQESDFDYYFGVDFGVISKAGNISLGVQLANYTDKITYSQDPVFTTSEHIDAINESIEKEVASETYQIAPGTINQRDTTVYYIRDRKTYDTVYYSHTDTVSPTITGSSKMHQQSIAIPVRYSYPISVGKRLVLVPTIGVLLSFVVHKEFVPSGQELLQRQSISVQQLAFTIGNSIEFCLIDNLSAYILPQYIYTITPLYSIGSAEYLKRSACIQLGISYKF